MKSREKMLNKLYAVRKEIVRAEDAAEACGDVGDIIGAYAWEDTKRHLESEAANLREALTKAGTFGSFSNPATNYLAGVWM
jgi:beta-galactosidase/beta-glucuronidase